MSKEHRDNVIDYIKRNDIRAIQGEPVTEEMIRDNWRKVVTPQSASSFVTPEQLDARAAHQRNVDVHEFQTRQMAEQRRYEAMTDDERELEADLMLVDLSKAKLAKAKAGRHYSAIERYELEVEQREATVAEKRERLAALAQRRTTDLVLQDDPDFRYALTSAEVNRDILDPLSADAVQNSVHLNAIREATQENYKAVVADFHGWEKQRYARLREEKQAAEAAALQQAAPAINAMHEASQQAADAGLRAADADARANRLRGDGDLQ